MRQPVLHLPAVPHTVSRSQFSHCAFTGKVERFPRMMQRQGFRVIHYGVAGAETGAFEQVDLMTEEEQIALLGHGHGDDPTRFVGKDANASSPLYRQFNYDLRRELLARVQPGDIICAPFGRAHEAALHDFPLLAPDLDKDQRAWCVETGIGYPDVFAPYRVYESEAWRHYHLGHPKRGGQGSDYEWVIPNYFDAEEWAIGQNPGAYVLYFGRLNDQKGLLIVCEIARRRPDLQFVICGQGDPTFYKAQAPNIEYLPPVQGKARASLLAEALCVLMPSRYVEPFGGVTVEAQLCGTPVLGSVFGSFTETIQQGENGYRCRTLGDFLAALELVETWHAAGPKYRTSTLEEPWLDPRPVIRQMAIARYSLEACGVRYAEVFETVAELAGDGYLAHRSHLGPITKAIVPIENPDAPRGFFAPPGNGPVTEADWKIAQDFERKWHLSDPRHQGLEQEKQVTYAGLLQFPAAEDPELLAQGVLYDFGEKRILDVGCGPVSLLLRSKVGTGVGVDPIDYGPELEAAYHARGLQRIIGPAERLTVPDRPFDEGWCYNCLQHVMDPAVILAYLGAHCERIRLFEWLDIPAHLGHPHELREAQFLTAFPEEKWERQVWTTGEFAGPALHGRYLALVVTRRA